MGDDDHSRLTTLRKLSVALKNSLSNRMQQRLVGLEIQGHPFRVNHGDALAYATACNDTAAQYFDKEHGIAPPLFASRILKGVVEEVLLHPRLGMNVLRMVHAEQSLHFIKPLTIGMEVIPKVRIARIREVSTGEILDLEVALASGSERVVEGTLYMFMRAWGLKARRHRPATPKAADGPREGADYQTVTQFMITPDQPHRYAAASGDYNPIHRNRVIARLAGFKGPIAHGLCVLAVTGARLVAHYADGDPARLVKLGARFSAPVYPGEMLTLKVRDEALLHLFVVENSKGKLALSGGEAVFR